MHVGLLAVTSLGYQAQMRAKAGLPSRRQQQGPVQVCLGESLGQVGQVRVQFIVQGPSLDARGGFEGGEGTQSSQGRKYGHRYHA